MTREYPKASESHTNATRLGCSIATQINWMTRYQLGACNHIPSPSTTAALWLVKWNQTISTGCKEMPPRHRKGQQPHQIFGRGFQQLALAWKSNFNRALPLQHKSAHHPVLLVVNICQHYPRPLVLANRVA